MFVCGDCAKATNSSRVWPSGGVIWKRRGHRRNQRTTRTLTDTDRKLLFDVARFIGDRPTVFSRRLIAPQIVLKCRELLCHFLVLSPPIGHLLRCRGASDSDHSASVGSRDPASVRRIATALDVLVSVSFSAGLRLFGGNDFLERRRAPHLHAPFSGSFRVPRNRQVFAAG